MCKRSRLLLLLLLDLLCIKKLVGLPNQVLPGLMMSGLTRSTRN
jgi:hypothetical protein